MRLEGARVLVTGADGFLGSHLAAALVARGARVRAMVLYNAMGSWGWLDDDAETARAVEVMPGDVRDADSVRAAVRGVEVVFHLAALIAIPWSYEAPRSYVETNVMGTLNVLQAARELGLARVVHTSTSEVYGTARYVPIDEQHPLSAQSPYAASKIAADQMALAYSRSFSLPVTVVRPFNTYGPRQSARAVIPTVIIQLARGDGAVKLGHTHPTRDFSHVADTAAGFMAVAEADACLGEVVNLGSSFEVSIGETAALIAEEMGQELVLDRDAERLRPEASEVERLYAATDKATRLSGWRPAYAGRDGFRRGLKETIAWFARPENLRRYKAEVYGR